VLWEDINQAAIVYAAEQFYACNLEQDPPVSASVDQLAVDIGYVLRGGDPEFEAHYRACMDKHACEWMHCKPWWN
jgi:hypothetical protein